MKKQELISVVVIAVLLYLYILWIKPFELINYKPELNLLFLIPAIIFSILSHLFLGLRYYYMLRDTNPEFPEKFSILIHYVTPILARITPGNLGETRKLFHKNLDREEAVFVHLNERIMDFIVLFLFSLGSIVYLPFFNVLQASIIIIILIIATIVVLVNIHKVIFLINHHTRFTINFRDKWYKYHLSRFTKKQIFVFVLYSFIIWLFTLTVYYQLANTAGLSISIPLLAVVMATVVIVISISGLPGGFGIRELTLTFILLELQFSSIRVTTFVLLLPLYYVVLESLFAIVASLLLRINRKNDSN